LRSPIRLSAGRRDMEKRTASVVSNAMAASMKEVRFSLVSGVAPMTANRSYATRPQTLRMGTRCMMLSARAYSTVDFRIIHCGLLRETMMK
jgi:hypothetical protein